MKRYLKRDDLFFVLRHGRIEGYGEKRFIGQTDVNLDNTGIKQAQYWGEMLKGFSIGKVFSSSLKRCTYTAEIIGIRTGYEEDSSINEINLGVIDGLGFDFVKKKYPLFFEERGKNIDIYRPDQGESFNDLKARTVPFWKKTKKLKGNCLVVTHAGVIRILSAYIKGIRIKEIFSINVEYGELFVIEKNN